MTQVFYLKCPVSTTNAQLCPSFLSFPVSVFVCLLSSFRSACACVRASVHSCGGTFPSVRWCMLFSAPLASLVQ